MDVPGRLNSIARSMRTDRNQLLGMMEHSPTMIAVFHGPDHVLEAANMRFRSLVPGRDLLGLAFREVFPTLADGPYHAALDAVFAEGKRLEARSAPWWVAPNREGRYQLFDYVYMPLHNASGEVDGVGVMAMDVSDARPARPPAAAERDVLADAPVRGTPRRSNIADLVDSLSHDLRTATHVVMGYASLLNRDGGELPGKLLGASRVLADLVNDMLDLECLRAGALVLDRRPLSFTALMDEAIADLAGAADAKGHRVVADLPAELPTLVADQSRLLRAVTHALDRAIELTPAGGEIRVEAHVEDGSLVCEIAGGGLALPDGQGLRVARALVEAQGGSLEVPHGATCRLRLPLVG